MGLGSTARGRIAAMIVRAASGPNRHLAWLAIAHPLLVSALEARRRQRVIAVAVAVLVRSLPSPGGDPPRSPHYGRTRRSFRTASSARWRLWTQRCAPARRRFTAAAPHRIHCSTAVRVRYGSATRYAHGIGAAPCSSNLVAMSSSEPSRSCLRLQSGRRSRHRAYLPEGRRRRPFALARASMTAADVADDCLRLGMRSSCSPRRPAPHRADEVAWESLTRTDRALARTIEAHSRVAAG